ncbi:hypothetical protein SAMN05216349_1456 [Oribacterium sp. KHPX15]|nr:hypothetical protein SAMN05216349_1456 [Oribacterium sp. KHPX15]
MVKSLVNFFILALSITNILEKIVNDVSLMNNSILNYRIFVISLKNYYESCEKNHFAAFFVLKLKVIRKIPFHN